MDNYTDSHHHPDDDDEVHFRDLHPIYQKIHTLERKIKHMATQAEVDAVTTAVGQVATDLGTAKTDLQKEIDELATANPGIDITKLQAAVAPVDAAVVALETIKPTPPVVVPPVEPPVVK